MATKTQGLKIRTKLLIMIMLLVLVFIFVSGVSYYGINQSLSQFNNQLPSELSVVHDLNYIVAKARRAEKEFLLYSSIQKNEEVSKKQQDAYKEMLDSFDKVLLDLNKLGTSGLAGEVSQDNQANRTAAFKMINTLKIDYAKVREAMGPLSELILSGKTLSQVEDRYAAYQSAAQTFEGHINDMLLLLGNMVELQNNSFAKSQEESITILLGIGGGLILFGMFAGLFFSTRLTAPLNTLMEGIEKVGKGEFTELKVTSSDEFAEIARIFNETMSRLKGFIKTEEERKLTEENVINFLEVVSEAAEGDLTLRAPVTEDAFGSIADAYNLMIESLADLLTDSSINAQEVGEESRHLLEIFQKMKEGADNQLHFVSEATDSAEETADSAAQIANKAAQAQQAAARVDEATNLGNERVNLNIEGMQLIRVTVQVINKKMKTLSERLLEIGTISQLISDVATRTTILAMNASIEASRAGEQGRGFLVISDEIKRLADEASTATRQIGGIIKAIQSEANEVTAALEEETSTVEEQTRLAQDTGEALAAINTATNVSKQVVTQITTLSQEQQRISTSMVSTIRKMAEITASTSALITESSAISEGLNGVSESLLQSLTQFKLSSESSEPVMIEELKEEDLIDSFMLTEEAAADLG